jgi:hypothetical protein
MELVLTPVEAWIVNHRVPDGTGNLACIRVDPQKCSVAVHDTIAKHRSIGPTTFSKLSQRTTGDSSHEMIDFVLCVYAAPPIVLHEVYHQLIWAAIHFLNVERIELAEGRKDSIIELLPC